MQLETDRMTLTYFVPPETNAHRRQKKKTSCT